MNSPIDKILEELNSNIDYYNLIDHDENSGREVLQLVLRINRQLIEYFEWKKKDFMDNMQESRGKLNG